MYEIVLIEQEVRDLLYAIWKAMDTVGQGVEADAQKARWRLLAQRLCKNHAK